VLDADEVLDPTSVPHVRDLVARGGDVGYVVTRRNLAPEPRAGIRVDHAVRLFPNRADRRYRNRVHETVDASIVDGGGSLRLGAVLIDHVLPAAHVRREKSRRYLALLLDDVSAHLNAALYHWHYAHDVGRARADLAAALRLAPSDARALSLLDDIVRAAGGQGRPLRRTA
jgi:hypothetical protein